MSSSLACDYLKASRARPNTARTLLLSSVSVVAAMLGSTVSGQAQTTTSFVVGGQVKTPKTFTLSDLQALPAITENVSFLAGSSTTNTTFTGVSLFNLLNTVTGIRLNPAISGDNIQRNVVIATGSDGFQQVYAIGEINPSQGGNAVAFNGAPVSGPELIAYANAPGQLLGSDGFARTTEPGDARGSRYVSNLASVSVLHAPIWSGPFVGGPSSSFTVTGQVNTPSTFTAASLAAMPTVTTVSPITPSPGTANFTGVPVWDILQKVGVLTNPAVKNNLERDFVIATGSDRFQATVSVAEIDPSFGAHVANPIIVAFLADGAPIVSAGAMRLITPDDSGHGRWVSNLVNLELFDVSNWKILAGESIDMSGFNYQTVGLTLAGGTLTSSSGPATFTAPTYVSNGGTIDTNVTLGATGAVTQASGTTLLLGNILTPNVAISGGTLQLGAGQRLSNATTLAMSGGTFDLNGFAQTLSTLNGTGTVSLSSATSGGSLSVGSGTFNGAIVNGGAAAGSLTKTGTGTLVLNGANTYTGPTTINGGTLSVNGSIASSLTVNAGGTIGGTGVLPSTTIAGGTLAPGNSIGTVTVQGSLSFNAASTYAVEVSPTAADRTNVTGTASLAGNVLATFATGSYLAKSYTILHAAALNGSFASLTNLNLPANFNTSLSYTSTDATLNLTAALGAGTALNSNQQSVANSINGFFNAGGAMPAAFNAVFAQTGSALGGGLSQLSGEAATANQQGAFQLMTQFLGVMLDPFVDGRGELNGGGTIGFAPHQQASLPPDVAMAYAGVLKAPPKALDPDRRWALWGAAYGGANRTDGNTVAGTNDLTARTYGFAGGADYHVTPNTVLGIALAGGGTDWSLSTGLGGGRSDVFQAGVYGTSYFGPAYVAAALAFTDHWMTTDRFAFATDHLTARFNAQSYGGRIEGGYRYGLMQVGVTPYAALQAQTFHTPTYTETDVTLGGFGLSYAARNATDTRSELGARFDYAPPMTGMRVLLRGRLAWAHDWVSDPSLVATFQTLPGASFIVNGASPAHDSALASASAELHLTRGVSLIGRFDGEFAENSNTYAGTGTVRFRW